MCRYQLVYFPQAEIFSEQTAPFLRRWLLLLCGGTSKLRILETPHGRG